MPTQNPLFKNLKILEFHDIYSFHTLKFMYLFREGFLPNMFNEMFLLTNSFIVITLETLIRFTYITVERILDSLAFAFVDQNYLTSYLLIFKIPKIFPRLKL